MDRNIDRVRHLPRYHQPQTDSERPLNPATRRAFNSRLRRRAAVPTRDDQSTSTLMDRLSDATSEADTLLEQPIPHIGSPDISTREYEGEAAINSRRKRRKTSHQSSIPSKGIDGFRYSYRGSVASGPLHMEIVSCDGGILRDAERQGRGREFHPDNLLHNDRSVYSTNSNRCNIMLRHIGETIFTLNKLVIKAPSTGFTAPIQEGLVFVSMSSRNLLLRTSCYRIRSPTPPKRAENSRPLSRRRDSSLRRVPPHLSTLARRSPRHVSPSSSPVETVPLSAGFDVMTHCESPSSDEEEPSSAVTLADLQRRGRGPPLYDGSSDTDEEIQRSGGVSARMLSDRPDGERRVRRRRRAEPSRIDCIVTPLLKDTEAVLTADRKPEDLETLPPHARFFIEKDRDVVSIRFNPPV